MPSAANVARASFIAALLVSTAAMLERFAEVVAPYVGIPAGPAAAVLVAAYAGYLIVVFRLLGGLLEGASNRVACGLLLAFALALTGAFLFLYPLADSGVLGFQSDRDEAIDIAVKALWSGTFPYDCRAVPGVHSGCPQTGNPIAPMPGALIIAAPVLLLLGSAAWLSLLSIGFAYVGLRRLWGDGARAARFIVMLLACAPVIAAEILTGGDHFANAVLVSLPLLLLIQNPRRRYARALAFFFGVALSWRALFWLAIVPVAVNLLRQRRARELLELGVFAALGFGVVTVPFLLWDFSGFSPWTVQQRYDLYSHLVPGASIVIPAGLLALGVYLGWRAANLRQLAIACGWMLFLPILIAVALSAYDLGRPTAIFYGWYALTSLLVFGVAADGFSPRGGAERGQGGPVARSVSARRVP
ncbi:MAG: hypothetical protein K9M02_12015 [Thiohalocapsa sp.]|nr:hypothetical protein [Thiohalocapsa sp.]